MKASISFHLHISKLRSFMGMVNVRTDRFRTFPACVPRYQLHIHFSSGYFRLKLHVNYNHVPQSNTCLGFSTRVWQCMKYSHCRVSVVHVVYKTDSSFYDFFSVTQSIQHRIKWWANYELESMWKEAVVALI